MGPRQAPTPPHPTYLFCPSPQLRRQWRPPWLPVAKLEAPHCCGIVAREGLPGGGWPAPSLAVAQPSAPNAQVRIGRRAAEIKIKGTKLV